MQEGGETTNKKIDYIFKCLIGRSAENIELTTIENLFQEELADFQKDRQRTKELLSIGEHRVNTALNQTELATYTMVILSSSLIFVESPSKLITTSYHNK